jgi:hypothetical protein
MLQFKSFMFATVTKTMMPIAQDRDKAMVQGMSTMMALGALTYILKSYASGKEPEMSPEKLLFEGLDKSGLLGPIMEANNIWEKMGGYGIGRLTGAPIASRYASRSIAESLLGPTLGTINNVGSAVSALNAGEFSDSDKKNVRRLIPFNNLWAINTPMSNMDEQTRAKLGY